MINTTESNKLIAEFMGYQECPMKLYQMDDRFQFVNILSEYQDEDEYLTIEAGTRTIKFNPKDMKFNESWDWLMPVIEKCRESQIFGSQRLISNVDKRLLKLDLIATYRNVVDFIEWHNLNN